MKICNRCGQLYSPREGCCIRKDARVRRALLVLKNAFEKRWANGFRPDVNPRIFGTEPFDYLNALGNALGQPTCFRETVRETRVR